MEKPDNDLYYDLTYYTLAHPDKTYFIHQHVVDAFTAKSRELVQKKGADYNLVKNQLEFGS